MGAAEHHVAKRHIIGKGSSAKYISSNALSSVYWAVPFGEKEISVMLNQVKDILAWYDNMKIIIPKWYNPKTL